MAAVRREKMKNVPSDPKKSLLSGPEKCLLSDPFTSMSDAEPRHIISMIVAAECSQNRTMRTRKGAEQSLHKELRQLITKRKMQRESSQP